MTRSSKAPKQPSLIDSLSGISQIFDNDSLPALQDPEPVNNTGTSPEALPKLLAIQANSVLEGTNKNLIYSIEFDQKHPETLVYQFDIGGNATFGLDYQTGDNAYLTNGVINNGDGSITVPAGVRSFEAHVPVIDDNIIEKTEVASIQIGSSEGIAQIFDNDSLPSLPKPGLGADPTSQQPLTAQSVPVASITANSVTEGDGNNLLFNVELINHRQIFHQI